MVGFYATVTRNGGGALGAKCAICHSDLVVCPSTDNEQGSPPLACVREASDVDALHEHGNGRSVVLPVLYSWRSSLFAQQHGTAFLEIRTYNKPGQGSQVK